MTGMRTPAPSSAESPTMSVAPSAEVKTASSIESPKATNTSWDEDIESPPPFLNMLRNPIVKLRLPKDFNDEREAEHILNLWSSCSAFKEYRYVGFVHAGGSGMVFKVVHRTTNQIMALKIARERLFQVKDSTKVADSLSPVSEAELKALQRVFHQNMVRLFNVIRVAEKIVAISTTYVDSPLPIDTYIRWALQRKQEKSANRSNAELYTPERLEAVCMFLTERFLEVASAATHMHALRMYHFDIKPANVLISNTSSKVAILTDLGACVHADELGEDNPVRVHFTWLYAHPELTKITSDPGSISGGGLKASALVKPRLGLERFDLYSFGQTMLEVLGVIELEFGERCHSSYHFRYLHLIACLLLDGRNAPSKYQSQRVFDRDDVDDAESDAPYFCSELALGYPTEIFSTHRIKKFEELIERLGRIKLGNSWSCGVQELERWHAQTINLSSTVVSPFSDRVSRVMQHPALQRLKNEFQLGWVKEVYPGATHTRWLHTVGVFHNMCLYYSALLSDPEIPTLKALVDRDDIDHALIGGLLHDVGQSSFGHDFEVVSKELFDHKAFIRDLLTDPHWGEATLEKTIKRWWPSVDIGRVLRILRVDPENPPTFRPIDGVAEDCIDGPIDADKFDYIFRDSQNCGVSYGYAIDRNRFLQSLTVSHGDGPSGKPVLCLAYRAKGRPAIEGLMLARYQLYGAVYWHHTFRCIQAMFTHAAGSVFPGKYGDRQTLRGMSVHHSAIRKLYYHKVICRKSWTKSIEAIAPRKLPADFRDPVPDDVANEPALDFLWRFADENTRKLIQDLAERRLYKRIFEIRTGSLGRRSDYSALKAMFTPHFRVEAASKLQQAIVGAIDNAIKSRMRKSTPTEHFAKERFHSLGGYSQSLVVLDYPTRGVPSEPNLPREIKDSERKYFVLDQDERDEDRSIFDATRKMQEDMATLRVYCHPQLHELALRYLGPVDVRSCMESVFSFLRKRP